jgi:hypothetical protein
LSLSLIFRLFFSSPRRRRRRRDDDDENDEHGAGSLGHGRVDASGPAAVRSLLFTKNVHFPLIIPCFVSLHVLLLQKQGGPLTNSLLDIEKASENTSFLTHLFSETTLRSLLHAGYFATYADPCLEVREHLCFCYCKFISNYTMQLNATAVLATCSRT